MYAPLQFLNRTSVGDVFSGIQSSENGSSDLTCECTVIRIGFGRVLPRNRDQDWTQDTDLVLHVRKRSLKWYQKCQEGTNKHSCSLQLEESTSTLSSSTEKKEAAGLTSTGTSIT